MFRKNTCPVWLAQVTLFSIVLHLEEVAFEEMAHAVLGEGGRELGTKVAFAVDVEQGADVWYFIG